MSESQEKISRREFIAELLKKSSLAVGLLAAGSFFVHRNPFGKSKTVMTVPSFSVAPKDIFAIARGNNPRQITSAAIKSAGGMKRFINKGDKVLIKVNCAFARPAWMGATTSPEVLSEVIKQCYEAQASKVYVADNPINNAKLCFERSGLADAIHKADGQLLLPSENSFAPVRVSSGVIGVWPTFYKPFTMCDKLIGIPTLKTHNLCGASLAMKNWYGFIGGSRNRFHQNIYQVVAELGEFISPTLIVLDATRALIRNGPTGGSSSDVVTKNTVAVSTDQVAIDAFGLELLGIDKAKVKYIQLAESKGIGTSDYRKFKHFSEVKI